MKKFKFSAIFIALLILLFSLSACGSNETVSEEKETEATSGSETTEEAAEPEEEAIDLGGRTIRIANHWDMTPIGGTEIGDETVARQKEIEEKYNIKIEYVVVPWEEKMNKTTSTIMAGEPFADLISVDSSQALSLVKNDYIIALDDLIDVNNTKLPDNVKQVGSFDGKVYMLADDVNASGGMYYNKTMFAAAGLPDPYEQFKNGEWTWEAMLNAAKKLTIDTNGDGTIDQFGLSGAANELAEYLVVTNGGQILNMETGVVEIDSPNAIEGYEFMTALINEHKVVKPNDGDTWNDPRNFFTEGKVAMTQGWTWEAEGRAEVPFEWGYVFWPKGPKATEYVAPMNNFEGITIPKGVESPEVVYQIWEDLQLWDRAEELTTDWFYNVLPNEESVDVATQMLNSLAINYWPAYNIGDAFYEMNDSIATGTESPAQAVTKVKEQAQARVDEFLGN